MKVVSATNEGNIELSGGDKQGLGERILFINFPPKTKPLFIDFVADTACRLLEQRLNLQGETKERPNDAIGFSASWDAKHHAVDVKSKKSGERLLSVWPYAGHSEHAEPVAMALCWHLQAKQDHERNRFQRAGHFLISLLEEMPWNRPSKVGASAKPSNDAASPK